MKSLTVVGFTFALLVLPLGAQSKSSDGPLSNSAATSELAALEQFLNLSDAELAKMEAVIGRLRAMTPAQRAALRAEMVAFRELPETQRQQIRQGWGGVSPEIQNGWREMMQGLDDERRAEIQQKLQSLAPDEKIRYRHELVEAYLKAKASQK